MQRGVETQTTGKSRVTKLCHAGEIQVPKSMKNAGQRNPNCYKNADFITDCWWEMMLQLSEIMLLVFQT